MMEVNFSCFTSIIFIWRTQMADEIPAKDAMVSIETGESTKEKIEKIVENLQTKEQDNPSPVKEVVVEVKTSVTSLLKGLSKSSGADDVEEDDLVVQSAGLEQQRITKKDLLSTGSTLLNLACSGRVEGGLVKGKYYFIVGDSASGKTWLSLTCFAEACLNPNFKDYRFIYDNAEDGACMDFERFFGRAVVERIEPPKREDGQPVFSTSLEEFYFNLDDALSHKQPCIYVLDSMDALITDEEDDKFHERKNAFQGGKDMSKISGSYGTSKAKMNSQNIRRACHDVRKTRSILIVLSQTRDSIGFGAQFNPKTRSGGHALRFWATLEIWSSIKEKLHGTVRGKDRQFGITSKVDVKKNRLTGKLNSVEVPIYHSYGIDDIGGCIDYLLEEKHWEKGIEATEFNITLKQEKLIKWIEEHNKEEELRQIVQRVWDEIEQKSCLKRKRRYE